MNSASASERPLSKVSAALNFCKSGWRMKIFLVLLVLFSSVVRAENFDFASIDWRALGGRIKVDEDRVAGTWKNTERWPGEFCNGTAHYDNEVKGSLDTLDLNVKEGNIIEVDAIITDIRVDLEGDYRSEFTFCEKVRARIPVAIDSLRVKAKVVFKQASINATPYPQVTIKNMVWGTIRFSRDIPESWETYFTSLVNRAVGDVWASNLGGWLNRKINEEIVKNFPNGVP
jgi:hypothetical protein